MFECPADTYAKKLGNLGSNRAKFSYGINRSAVKFVTSSGDATSFETKPSLRMTKFKIPSQMIFVGDAAWNQGAESTSEAQGYLYNDKRHPNTSWGEPVKPGSLCHQWDQNGLGGEYSKGGDVEEGDKRYWAEPWHVSKSWNYSFMDGHASNMRPEQTVNLKEVSKNERKPSGYWTWDQHKAW
jgi:hypothetical protein